MIRTGFIILLYENARFIIYFQILFLSDSYKTSLPKLAGSQDISVELFDSWIYDAAI